MKYLGMVQTIKTIYVKPKYIALNIFLAVILYGVFLYSAYLQGGNSIMTSLPAYLVAAQVLTAAMLMTIAIYSIKNTRRNSAKISASTASVGTTILGSGLCGCVTTIIPSLALATGANLTSVFALSAFLKNYSIEIISFLIALNVMVIVYYANKLSSPRCSVKGRL